MNRNSIRSKERGLQPQDLEKPHLGLKWPEMARRDDFDVKEVLDQANKINASEGKYRVEVQISSLIRANNILQSHPIEMKEGIPSWRLDSKKCAQTCRLCYPLLVTGFLATQ